MVEPVSTKARHETRDISVRVVVWFAIGLITSALLLYPAISGLYKLFEHFHPSPDRPSRIAFHPHMIAPAPRLQVEPTQDLAQYEAAQSQQLHSYGWIDRRGGVAHIPIERAMDLIAQRGLPTRGPGTQNSSGQTPEELQRIKATATKP